MAKKGLLMTPRQIARRAKRAKGKVAVSSMKSQHGSAGGVKMRGGGGATGGGPAPKGKIQKVSGKGQKAFTDTRNAMSVRNMNADSAMRRGVFSKKQYRERVTEIRNRDRGTYKAARADRQAQRRDHSVARRKQRENLKSTKRAMDLQEMQYKAQYKPKKGSPPKGRNYSDKDLRAMGRERDRMLRGG